MIFEYKDQRISASSTKEAAEKFGISEQELITNGKQIRYELRTSGKGYDERLSSWKKSRDGEDKHAFSKELVDELKFNQCSICGFDGVGRAKTFHHVEPKFKDFEIRVGRIRIEGLQEEVGKTVLLCLNCHAFLHHILEGNFDDAEAKRQMKEFYKRYKYEI